MNFQELFKNKMVLIGTIAGAVVLVIVTIVVAVVISSSNKDPKEIVKPDPLLQEDYSLIKLGADQAGKGYELIALLARNGIEVKKTEDGNKINLALEKGTKMSTRDTAILTIVKSGLFDKNTGLEIFDKGDITASSEERKIKLTRAVNSELARLIKKIKEPIAIEDASVFVSMPQEPSMFTSEQKPITATVQITVGSGEKIDKSEVRAITNLLVGSVQGLDASNLSITDTNGNVYNSITKSEDDMMDQLEESDHYMKNKVMSQLDRLLGKGNYVVTISTYLRETPLQTNTVVFDPKKSSVLNEQRFSESLGDSAKDTNRLNGAVSNFLPGGLPNQNSSSNNRNYNRSAADVNYGVTKTEYSEVKNPGIIEDITIALTLDSGTLPQGMTINDLKELVARAASPKASANNVKIAFTDGSNPILTPDMPSQLPKPESSGNPWWTVAVLLAIGLLGGLIFIYQQAKKEAEKQQYTIDNLLEQSEMQKNLLREAQEKASLIQQQLQTMISTQDGPPSLELHSTLDNIRSNMDDMDDKELAIQLKSWIESI